MGIKSKLIKELEKNGVRKGMKYTGELVSLSHLKTYEIINLWYDTFKE